MADQIFSERQKDHQLKSGTGVQKFFNPENNYLDNAISDRHPDHGKGSS